MIMEASMRSMMKRTNKPIRPWVQGFWYQPQQIAEQIDGIEKSSGSSWSIWSPTGRYGLSYKAMADRSGVALSKPKYYPTMADLSSEKDRSIRGHSTVVNFTSFKAGYSILSLEASENGKRSSYFSPAAIVATLEESIMDHILEKRNIPIRSDAEPYTKRKLLSDLMCSDLEKDARRMRPEPIYIDWVQNCIFSTNGIPQPRLDVYAQVARQPEPVVQETASTVSRQDLTMASISENTFGVALQPEAGTTMTMLSR
jgi:hypothetical protein